MVSVLAMGLRSVCLSLYLSVCEPLSLNVSLSQSLSLSLARYAILFVC